MTSRPTTARAKAVPGAAIPTAALAITLAITLAATHAAAQVQLRAIDPELTDPAITPVDPPTGLPETHTAAIDPAVPAGARPGLLYVYLPGSGGVPVQYEHIVAHAASIGWHAIGLTYPNWPAIRDLIAGESDPDLPEAIRRERLFGLDLTDAVDVAPPDAVQSRLASLLAYLDGRYPEEGWDRYLDADGLPRWRAIVVAGHSQGAGHAALLTKDFSLGGALLFGGPGDFVTGMGPAPWLTLPSRTPTERMLAFTHIDDPTAAGFFLNQRLLGLDAFGPLEVVDGKRAGELSSHMLTSTLAVPPRDAHGAVAVDDRLPLDASGQPVYEPAWAFMLTEAARDSRGCRADVNADGELDLFDFLDFQTAFADGDGRADVDGDGRPTLFDFLLFQNLFTAGCD